MKKLLFILPVLFLFSCDIGYNADNITPRTNIGSEINPPHIQIYAQSSGVEVAVYESESDYINGVYLLKRQTDQEGRAGFAGLQVREYYLVATTSSHTSKFYTGKLKSGENIVVIQF